MITIKKGSISREKKEKERVKTAETANRAKAVTDYNLMMGVLEDPAEEDENE